MKKRNIQIFVYYLDILQRPLELAENNSLNPESYNMKEKGEQMAGGIWKILPEMEAGADSG